MNNRQMLTMLALCRRAEAVSAGADALAGIRSRHERREVAKQQLALAAHQLLQDPNQQVAQLRGMLGLLQDDDAQVHRRAARGTAGVAQRFGVAARLAVRPQLGQCCPKHCLLPCAGVPARHANAADSF